jgi:predicted esterase YcpF (UPF0227 family)
MKHARKNNNSDSFSFSDEKDEVLNLINSFMEEYEKFTKTVSPKNWRTTGHHFTELRKMKDDIVNFSELSKKKKKMNGLGDRLNKILLHITVANIRSKSFH